MSFIPLNITSAYTLLSSTLPVKTIIDYAAESSELKAIALTDKNVLYGVEKFYSYAHEKNIKPILGLNLEVHLSKDTAEDYPLVLIAKDNIGYEQLVQLSSRKMGQNGTSFVLKQCINLLSHLYVILPIQYPRWQQLFAEGNQKEVSMDVLKFLKTQIPSDQLYVGITDPMTFREQEKLRVPLDLPLVAIPNFTHAKKENSRTLDVLEAIKEGKSLEEIKRKESRTQTYSFEEIERLETAFESQGLSQAWHETSAIAAKVQVDLPKKDIILPAYPVPEGQSSSCYLRQLSFNGLRKRQRGEDKTYVARLDKELSVIDEMGFPDYFLIVWDIMRYAKQHNIQTGPGRGSAAGSLVAYALNITEVDPIHYNLLFERFLNSERSSPPDIDLDFPDNKRGAIIRYIQKKYGKENVAQIITFGTLGAKQAIRDAGRVLGLSTQEQNAWSKFIPSTPGISLRDARKESRSFANHIQKSEFNQMLYQIAIDLEGLPRNISTHASGIVISEKRLTKNIPIQSGGTEIVQSQYDMDSLESIGFLKFDILGLKNLTILDDAVAFIRKDHRADFKLKDIPLDDMKTFRLFQKADTNGIFQFESQGMRRVLKQMRPTEFEDIVAVISLYRPGPMDEIPTYINRKHEEEAIIYLHPSLENILDVTYGILIYQEQIMRVAAQMAGYTLGEADILRRGIGKKDRELIERERRNFQKGALRKGYSVEEASHVYDAIERFADYGFNRSHAVAYSLIAYQMAYMKAHYPVAFYAAICRSATKNKADKYVLEMKRKGMKIYPPDVNLSNYNIVPYEDGILPGYSAIKGLRKDFIQHVLEERKNNGKYTDMVHFIKRLDDKYRTSEYLEKCIYSGLFDTTGDDRGSLIYSLPMILDNLESGQFTQTLGEIFEPKIVKADRLSDLRRIEAEHECLGLLTNSHPTATIDLTQIKTPVYYIAELETNKTVHIMGIIHDVNRIKTKHGEPMAFVTVSDSTGQLSLTFFPEQYRKFGRMLGAGRVLIFEGQKDKNKKQDYDSFLANKIFEIADLTRSSSATQLFIQLKSENEIEIKRAIYEVITKHRGKSPILFHIKESNQTYRLKEKFWIDVNKDSISALEKIVGEENIVVQKGEKA